ncbi:MAG TPA: 16S rRNA (cytosine(1402)-N(4))-methyltransferase RsmH [Gammaproteobacteria bacterium]|nr:16S rRNA (cytosine(1402)-N(4))-methyltransferase RsmH [Gammaproteobacteria bacterium]
MPYVFDHRPVLLSEVLTGLAIDPSGIYIDGTFGRGGHSRAILEKLNEHGKLFAIDQDPEAEKEAHKIKNKNFYFIRESFKNIKKIADENNITANIAGILLDLGVSSPQLDDATRGFSFQKDGPLDMRMDPDKGQSVAEFLETVREEKLAEILKTYGEERFAKKIARAIVTEQKEMPITNTLRLAEIIKKANPAWERDKHPATRAFQALRIYINQELEVLRTVLPHCLEILKNNGRLAVVSFHSLEDRIVKQFIQEEIHGDVVLRQLPIKDRELKKSLRTMGRAIKPTEAEMKDNPRSRSAILRIVEKLS